MLTEQEARELLLKLHDTLEPYHWPLYRLWGAIRWLIRKQPKEWGQCPWCGFGKDDWEWFMYKAPWFQYAKGGQYAPPGEPTVHWFEGLQSCPRCWYKWWVQDSN